MSGKRENLICGPAVAGAGRPGMAAARPRRAEPGSACAVARTEPRLLVQGPGGALAPSPGTGREAPGFSAASIAAPGPEAQAPVIPDRAPPRHRAPRGRRTGPASRSRALRPGGTARGQKRHAKAMGCVSFQGARDGFSEAGSTRDNSRYRESGVNSPAAPCNRAAAANYAPAIRCRAIPLCNLLIQRVFFASGRAPGAVGANRRRPGGQPCRFSIIYLREPTPCTASGARTPAHAGGERRTIRRRAPTRGAEGGRAARRRFAAPGGARRSG